MDYSKFRTRHFTLLELIKSDVAKKKKIANEPDEEAVNNLLAMMYNILEPAREKIGVPIIVSSGYRSASLNKAVGGVENSQHMKGEAVDLVCTKRADKLELFKILSTMDVDQLLFETNKSGTQWIHLSYKSDGTNRHYINNNYKA